VLHRKLTLDSRPIPRTIHKKICPLSALSEHSNSVIRHVRLLRYGDAATAPYSQARTAIVSLRVHGSSGVWCRSHYSITKSLHQLHILESGRQLRSVVPQLLQRHQACTQLPEGMRQLRCGAPQLLRHHQARTQLPERMRQLRCGVPQRLRHHQGAHTAPTPRECTAAPVWCAAAAPALPIAYNSSPSACVSSSVGCRSNSVITKSARSSHKGLYLKTPTIISTDRGTARKESGKRRWYPRSLRRFWPIPGERRVGSRCIQRPNIVKGESYSWPRISQTRAAESISFTGGLRMKIRIVGSTDR